MNLVFEKPTINLCVSPVSLSSKTPLTTRSRSISSFLVAFANNESVKELSQVEQMGALIEKYRHFDVPAALPPTATSPPSASTVLLSGATGSLGANQLAQLLSKPEVKKVYALVRAKNDEDASIRVANSLKKKGLAGAGDSRIVALAADFSQDRLGLSKQQFEQIKTEVTVVLHVRFSPFFSFPSFPTPGADH